MDEHRLSELRAKLVEEKARVEKDLKGLGSEGPGPDADFVDRGDDEDSNAQEVTAFQEDLSLENNLEITLSMVDAALARMDAGTYGLCENGEPIPEDRLKALPWAATCIDHG